MPVAVTRDPYYTLTFTLQDKAAKGYTSLHVGEAAGVLVDPTNATFLSFVSEMADNIEAISDCTVVSISLSLGLRVTGSAGYGPSPNVERKAVFQFNTAAGFPALVTVPGINEAAIEEDGINIQRTGTVFEGTLAVGLQAFHDKLQNGATVGLATFPVTDRRGSDFNGLLDAYKQHRRSSRG